MFLRKVYTVCQKISKLDEKSEQEVNDIQNLARSTNFKEVSKKQLTVRSKGVKFVSEKLNELEKD